MRVMGAVGSIGLFIVAALIGAASMASLWPVTDQKRWANSSAPIVFCLPSVIETEDGCATQEDLLGARAGLMQPFRPFAMVHPTNFAVPERVVSLCEEFRELRGQGWGGMTSRDLAAEADAVARCGLLIWLSAAAAPDRSYFSEGRLNTEDLLAVPVELWPSFGEGVTTSLELDRTEEIDRRLSRYTLRGQGFTLRVLQVAHADFDDDKVGDVLVFVLLRADGGTFRNGRFMLLQKNADGAVVLLS